MGSRGLPQHCPMSLSRHFLHLLQRRIRSSNPSVEDLSTLGHGSAPSKGETSGRHSRVLSKSFLGVPMPTVNVSMNMNLDVRKWAWPESLSFGMGGSANDKFKKAKSIDESDGKTISQARSPSQERPALPQSLSEIPIDTQSLVDALSSNSVHQSPKATGVALSERDLVETIPHAAIQASQKENPPSEQDESEEQPQAQSSAIDSLSSPPFTETYLHFDSSVPFHTRRRLVRYLSV